MKVVLFPSPKRPRAQKLMPQLVECLRAYEHITLLAEEPTAKKFCLEVYKPSERVDVMITLGGDGTLLWYIRKYSVETKALFVGLNVGNLGFLADIDIDQMQSYISDLVSGEYKKETRIMLESTPDVDGKYYAVNDIVLHRGAIKNMIHLKVSINGLYFNTFTTDGLIVATPTGSSAYSLSAGGPLMQPTLDALIITPICPHSLTNRPFVVRGDSVIDIEYMSDYGPIEYTFDGIETFTLQKDRPLRISACSHKFTVASFDRKTNYFQTVRSKLHWTGKSLPT